MRGEFRWLAEGLERLYKTLVGEAAFNAFEGQLKLGFKGDGRGHVLVSGAARTDPGSDNELRFSIELDQTYLPSLIRQLKSLEP